jgi:signal transduction histidine kinase
LGVAIGAAEGAMVIVAVAVGIAVASLTALARARRRLQKAETATRAAESQAAEYRRVAEQIAHDVLNPISAARLSAESLMRKMTGSDYDALSRCERGLRRAEQILSGIMEFARAGSPQAGVPASSDLRRVVEEVVEALVPQASAADEQIVVEHLDSVEVGCNEGLLSSAVSNLVRNAIKYTSESEERRIAIRVVDRGGSGRFEVEDTGPGIADELTDHIFDPYVRAPTARTKPGLGLGLATVRRVIEAHGGQVGVQSAVGHGSCFWFEVPKPRS